MDKILKAKVQEIRFTYKIVLYIIFGVLWSFANVGYSFGLLTWFAFVPFLFSIKYENLKSGIILSWIFGITAYIFHFWWMTYPFVAFFSKGFASGGMIALGFIVGWLITLLTSAYHGLMYVIIFVVTKYIVTKKRGSFFYLTMPFVFTVVDFFFPKLWYDQLGYSQYVFFNFSQIADIFGVPIITFIVIFSNSAILILIEAFLYKKHIRYGIAVAATAICMIVAASIYGDIRQKQILQICKESPKAKIGVVQGNFSGLDKKNAGIYSKMIFTYNDLSKKLLNKSESPDLIVWPETSIPMFFEEETKDFSYVKEFSKTPLLFGTHIIEGKRTKDNVFNALVLLSPDSEKIDQYYKHKLVPFTEGMPFKFLNFIMNAYGLCAFGEGTEYKIMQVGNIKMATNICYEDIIPRFIKESLNVKGVESNLIVNATNDSWFGKTIEPGMHLRMAGFRAIENRKSLVRSTCTGFSGVFDPTGNLIYISKLMEQDSAVIETSLLEIKTIYRQGGWTFVYFLGLIVLIIFIYAVIRKVQFYFKKSKMIAENHHKKLLYRVWTE